MRFQRHTSPSVALYITLEFALNTTKSETRYCQQGHSLIIWAQGTLLTRPNRELDLYQTKWDFHLEHSLWVRPPSQQARAAAVEEEDFHHHLQ